MKKLLLVTASIFLLMGCSQINNNASVDKPVTDQASESTYQNKKFNISFNYPSNWTIKENDAKKSVTVQSNRPSNGSEIMVTVPAESFKEYENKMSELIASGQMSVENSSPIEGTSYATKKYGHEGGLYYLIEINGKYVGIEGEMYLTQDQKEGLKEILNSLSL